MAQHLNLADARRAGKNSCVLSLADEKPTRASAENKCKLERGPGRAGPEMMAPVWGSGPRGPPDSGAQLIFIMRSGCGARSRLAGRLAVRLAGSDSMAAHARGA